jgi:hypothetical protein
MSDDPRVAAVLQAIADQARRDPEFLTKLERALIPHSSRPAAARTRSRRRAPAVVDPFEVLSAAGATGLRERLATLSLDELRDIVAEYRVEPYTLAMRWKTQTRLIDLIADTIEQRSRKGEAFR